jgi:hypothetical protein
MIKLTGKTPEWPEKNDRKIAEGLMVTGFGTPQIDRKKCRNATL